MDGKNYTDAVKITLHVSKNYWTFCAQLFPYCSHPLVDSMHRPDASRTRSCRVSMEKKSTSRGSAFQVEVDSGGGWYIRSLRVAPRSRTRAIAMERQRADRHGSSLFERALHAGSGLRAAFTY